MPTILRGVPGADDDVRVVVVTGAGDEAFVSGADISEFGERRTTPEARAEYDRATADAGRAWGTVEKPIIAMIRGYCMGGGVLTALQADIRIAAEGSQFGVPAARLGLGYGYGGVETLAARWSARRGRPRSSSRPAGSTPPRRSRIGPGEPGGARRRAGAGGAGAGRRHRGQRAADRAGDCKAAIHELRAAPAERDIDAGQRAGRGVLPLRGLPWRASRPSWRSDRRQFKGR